MAFGCPCVRLNIYELHVTSTSTATTTKQREQQQQQRQHREQQQQSLVAWQQHISSKCRRQQLCSAYNTLVPLAAFNCLSHRDIKIKRNKKKLRNQLEYPSSQCGRSSPSRFQSMITSISLFHFALSLVFRFVNLI